MAKAEATDRMVTVASPSASASAMAAAATPERVRRGVGPREPCSGRSQMLGDPFRVTARHGLDQAGRGRHPRLGACSGPGVATLLDAARGRCGCGCIPGTGRREARRLRVDRSGGSGYSLEGLLRQASSAMTAQVEFLPLSARRLRRGWLLTWWLRRLRTA